MERVFLNDCDEHGDVVAVDPFDVISDDMQLEDLVAALIEEAGQ